MPWPDLLAIAVALAMDAFAVSLAVAAGGWAGRPSARFRLWFHFGLFQAAMPVVGWLAGAPVAAHIAAWDHWIAFVLLCWIGIRMIREALGARPAGAAAADPTRGRLLVGLALATSLDALAVGFSFACLGLSVWRPAAVIGVVAAAFSLVGCLAGGRLGAALGRKLEAAGGVVLLLVGLRIVAEHLLR